MKTELQTDLERPKHYDNIDGTGEIFMGLMFLAFALISYLQPKIPLHTFWQRHGLLFMYAILLPILALGFLLRSVVKRNLTFPRTGYLAFPRDRKTIAVGMLCAGALGAIIAVIIAVTLVPLALIGRQHPFTMNITQALFAAALILPYAYWVWRMGKGQPWKWLILGFTVLGLGAVVMTFPDKQLTGWSTLLVGLNWIISGGATLVVYLLHNKPSVSEAK